MTAVAGIAEKPPASAISQISSGLSFDLSCLAYRWWFEGGKANENDNQSFDPAYVNLLCKAWRTVLIITHH